MSGYIKLHRKFQDHWLYTSTQPFTKREAFLDILLNVNFEEKKVRIGDVFIICKPGESLYSQTTLAKRWGWDRSKVQRFLDLLQKDEMIKVKSEHKTLHLTVCNWERYQGKRADVEHMASR